MKYIIWCFIFGSSLIALTILGEYMANKLPENHWFTKWWRDHMIGEDPNNPNF